MFNHDRPAVINAMRDIMIRVFEHLDTMSSLELDMRIKYTKRIMRNVALKDKDRTCWNERRRLGFMLGTS